MKFKIYYRYWLLVFSIVITAGCSLTNGSIKIQAYDGAKQAATKIATVVVPYELEVFEIDGKTISPPYIPNGTYQIELLPGEHEMMVIYNEFWGDNSNGSMVKSKVFLFKLTVTAADMFLLKHNAPQDLAHADFAMLGSEIKVWLYQRNTGKITQAFDTKEANGFLSPSTAKMSTQAPTPQAATAPQNPYDSLKHWWKMADDKQRQAFKDWVSKRSLNNSFK